MIASILKRGPAKYLRMVHDLAERAKELVEGTFYEPELQSVNVDSATEYRIEHVRVLVALAQEIR